VLAFRRLGGDDELAVLLNFTPVPRPGYRLGVPRAGVYHVVLDSDAPAYGGAGYRAETALEAQPRPWMGQPHSVVVDLPPLAALLIDRGER
jgi:1,4-alpha-glucan branching enzyme